MSSRTIVGCAALACAWVTAIGCGGSETTEPLPSPFDTEDGFCQKLAEAICNQKVVEACYLSDSSSLEEDRKSCIEQARRATVCNPQGYPYDKAGAEPCIEAQRAAYSDAKLDQDEIEKATEACLLVYSGEQGVGASCSFDHECNANDGLRCVDKAGEPGTCQEPEEIEPGLSCAGDGAVCQEGFFCSDNDACIQRPGPGSDCSESIPCVEDARCVNGTCDAKLSNGQSCTDPEQCKGGFCIKASGSGQGTCGASISLSPTNGSCDPFLPESRGTGGNGGSGGSVSTGGSGGSGGSVSTGGSGGSGGSGGA